MGIIVQLVVLVLGGVAVRLNDNLHLARHTHSEILADSGQVLSCHNCRISALSSSRFFTWVSANWFFILKTIGWEPVTER